MLPDNRNVSERYLTVSRNTNRDDFSLNNRHYGVVCTMCRKSGFSGLRYKCLRCRDHNLCETCHTIFLNTNDACKHFFQTILSPYDFQLFYGNEHLDPQLKSYSYTCPYCGRLGFDTDTLLAHLIEEHHREKSQNRFNGISTPAPSVVIGGVTNTSGSTSSTTVGALTQLKVLCPICSARMFHNHVFVTNLKAHIVEEHKDLGINLWRNIHVSDSQSSVLEYNNNNNNTDIGKILMK